MIAYDRFLTENLSKYKFAPRVREDVINALANYKELRPKMENFTFNDGTSQDLVCLEGTIPVDYHKSTYNIPIAIFLYETHPHTPPMVYVRPTSTMQIKASDFVDNNGLVHLPYISDWKHPGSDLIGLLAVLQVVFGERSPVFAKFPVHTETIPKPTPPVYVPYPQGAGFYAQPPILTSTDPGSLPGYIPPIPGVGWQIPTIPNMGGMQMPQLPNYSSPFPEPSGMPSLPTMSVAGQTMSYFPTPSNDNQRGSLTEDHLRLSLRSAVMDKIRRVQNELICQHGDELKAIQQAQSDLECGGQKLRSMFARMDVEQSEATQALESLNKKNAELSELVKRLNATENEPLNVDEAVDTTYPLYRQLVSSFAEEQAIEDAIFYLVTALGKGVLDVDVFLKASVDSHG
ncbi:hypothetical protein PHET_07659 [Paragonimus heterotremus]|uniref:UEV domain-containing protein n=1 Tax=Paragonimus heterotremus TaxID=100268 RepID=A0A8J4WD28_9TREM|nr:hypothetical protein PHET_07659 [Paragonimus heterotremus]